MAESPDISPSTPVGDETKVQVAPGVAIRLRPTQQLDFVLQQTSANTTALENLKGVPAQLEEVKGRLDGLNLNGDGPKLKAMVRDWDEVGPGLRLVAGREVARQNRRARLKHLLVFSQLPHYISLFIGAVISAGAFWVVNHTNVISFFTQRPHH